MPRQPNALDALCRALRIDRAGRTAAQLWADPSTRRTLEAALKDPRLAPMVGNLEADERGLLRRPCGSIVVRDEAANLKSRAGK